jgi:hypothetical protein
MFPKDFGFLKLEDEVLVLSTAEDEIKKAPLERCKRLYLNLFR